jgi:hypothetical protein
MKVLVIPLIVLSAVASELSEEPNEAQMRGAFERTLTAQVQNAIDFVAQDVGPQAAHDIRVNGTDRFDLRVFQKHACRRLARDYGYRCDFTFEIAVMNGSIQRALAGRFYAGADGLMFVQEEESAALPAHHSVL